VWRFHTYCWTCCWDSHRTSDGRSFCDGSFSCRCGGNGFLLLALNGLYFPQGLIHTSGDAGRCFCDGVYSFRCGGNSFLLLELNGLYFPRDLIHTSESAGCYKILIQIPKARSVGFIPVVGTVVKTELVCVVVVVEVSKAC
jgi:hypothetical protein